jgi:hypothetical protein
MPEVTMAEIDGERDRNHIEKLKTETNLIARQLEDEFSKLAVTTQALCGVELGTITGLLVEIDKQFQKAEDRLKKP